MWEKGAGNKTHQSFNQSQSWASWFVKKLNAWRWGIGSYILLKTGMTVVGVSLCPQHGSEYHYNTVQKHFTKNSIPDCHTFFLSQGKLRMSIDHFYPCSSSAENYPSRKLEYLSPQTRYINSQRGKWKIRIVFVKNIYIRWPLVWD